MNVLSVRNLYKSFGSLKVLENVNLEVTEGEVISIIGASGCGKSVFLRCLNCLEKPDAGNIFINGEEITAKDADIDKIRQNMGMVFQKFHLFSHLNVMDNLCLAPTYLLNMDKSEAQKKAGELLESVGLLSKAYEFPKVLSGGQQQRIAICRSLMMNPKILLLDEPTSALDPTMVGEVLAVIRMLAKKKLTMIIVTHEMQFAEEASNRVLFFADGGIYEEGEPDAIFNNPQKLKTIAFIRKHKFFGFEIKNRDEFDLMSLMGGIITFAEKYNIDRKRKNLLQACTEDIIYDFFKCSYDNGRTVDVKIDITYEETTDKIALAVISGGKSHNPFANANDADFESMANLSVIVVKKAAKSYNYVFENGKNVVGIEL